MTGAALDHVGVVGRDLAALADAYRRLGFTLTPLAPAAGGRIRNRCVMLRRGYLELMAVAPGGASATLERFLARHEGAHIIALAIDDIVRAQERFRLIGWPDAAPEQSERPIDAADPDGPRARFTHLPVPEQPEARINLIQHQTPRLVWQPRFLAHANHAVGLDDVTIAVAAPAETAMRFSRLAGRPVVPDPAGGYALDLARGRIRLLPAERLAVAPPRITAISLCTDDDTAAVRRIVADHAIPHRIDAGVVTVPPEAAGGVSLQFHPFQIRNGRVRPHGHRDSRGPTQEFPLLSREGAGGGGRAAPSVLSGMSPV